MTKDQIKKAKERQVQTAICESLGWMNIHENQGNLYGDFGSLKLLLPQVTCSRDVCWATFEQDATDEYWLELYYIVNGRTTTTLKHSSNTTILGWKNTLKATEMQRCEAWLRFKQLWKA